MKRKEFIADIKKTSKEELVTKARGFAEELMKLRFRKASGQLQQTHRIKELRRNLARVETQLSALTTVPVTKTAKAK